MSFAVVKAASYTLAHTPDFIPFGSTPTTAKARNDYEYFDTLKKGLRSFEDVVNYPPNQCYIGNITPQQLGEMAQPWYQSAAPAERTGKYGDILPQEEFFALLKASDAFDLVALTPEFIASANPKLAAHPQLKRFTLDAGKAMSAIDMHAMMEGHKAEPLTMNGELVGIVKQAHDEDENLSAHIMLENLTVKATGAHAALMLEAQGQDLSDIDYVIECSEEACGDINQRGGGNFAKAIAEMVGCSSATGSDLRGFCAAPAHSLVHAAALVKGGAFRKVMVVAGGAVAKLGMNSREHLAKDMPALEDCLAGFAFIVGENDGVSPIVNTDIIGRLNVGAGSSPQAVTSALVSEPLKAVGRKITDIDRYSAEMQNPEITKPAGAGDVPEANFKMIGALAVKEGQLERKELMNFVKNHGMPGFALTQGHIPSGVPYLGHGRDAIMNGDINSFMVIGKGSLFLGRMTNLFDGISTVVEKNPGVHGSSQNQAAAFDKDEARRLVAKAMQDVAARLAGSENE
ncbi:glycine/sarcosine/betaine reductase complex component C subunit beta [Sansalvadorimonas verongulae]|uniref:glycine/sarcosine/betaine reductase complex component C subunit beta n=1 Tax=Sansalvadorimonas verongulae TaxID=2172824 RepID=UPI002E307D36|nr:glycine/sarcosine/betaine reductase complex component C subunit beta [Sansalvadorimonas verongulae]MTI13135.1 glycine reductase [Sansalvadorimonas verongulae]